MAVAAVAVLLAVAVAAPLLVPKRAPTAIPAAGLAVDVVPGRPLAVFGIGEGPPEPHAGDEEPAAPCTAVTAGGERHGFSPTFIPGTLQVGGVRYVEWGTWRPDASGAATVTCADDGVAYALGPPPPGFEAAIRVLVAMLVLGVGLLAVVLILLVSAVRRRRAAG